MSNKNKRYYNFNKYKEKEEKIKNFVNDLKTTLKKESFFKNKSEYNKASILYPLITYVSFITYVITVYLNLLSLIAALCALILLIIVFVGSWFCFEKRLKEFDQKVSDKIDKEIIELIRKHNITKKDMDQVINFIKYDSNTYNREKIVTLFVSPILVAIILLPFTFDYLNIYGKIIISLLILFFFALMIPTILEKLTPPIINKLEKIKLLEETY